MTSFTLKGTLPVVALLLSTGVAAAQVTAMATTDLNIRSGPGPEYPVVGVIGGSQEATVHGCIENSKWCQVDHAGVQGWSYSDYLTTTVGSEVTVLTERPPDVVPSVTFERTASTGEGAMVGATTGAIAGAIIGGPAGAAIGAGAGAVAGGAAETLSPPNEVLTYVESHRLEPVYLEGEVVVGAALPETVVVQEIPNYEYRYVNVNNQAVLVEPDTRRIVYVVRN